MDMSSTPAKKGDPFPLSPTELTTLTKALSARASYVQSLAPDRYQEQEIAFLSALYFLDASAPEGEQALYCSCLVSLLERNCFVGKGGTFPLPEVDPSLGYPSFQKKMIAVLWGALCFHFYWQKRIVSPELALGPLSFQSGLLFEALTKQNEEDEALLSQMKSQSESLSSDIARMDALADLYPLFLNALQ